MHHSLHQRRGFTLVELLVVISIIAIIAGLVVPVLLRGRGEAVKIQCTNNLKQIYAAALTYSNKKMTFPLAATDGSSEPRAHESLNVLLKHSAGKGLEPKLFICGAGSQSAAEVEKGEPVVLDEDTLSYSWVAKKTKSFGTAKPLSSDKYVKGWEDQEGHDDGMLVLMTDNSVTPTDVSELDQDTGLPEGLVR